MPAIAQALLASYGGAPVGSPSASEIIITSNAEIEASAGDIVSTSASLASGVTGAHGRVFDNNNLITTFTYPGGQEEFVSAGCRFQIRTDPGTSQDILRFRRDPSGAQVNHIRITRSAAGLFQVLQGSGTTLATGAQSIATTTWYYITLYVRVHDTLGEFTAKIFDASGALLETLSGSGVDTKNGGTTLAEQTVWGNSSLDTYIDHLWTDLNGAFRGCGYVETLSPNAAGDNSGEWTRGGTNSGADYSQVSEVPKNTTSYLFSTGADQVALFNFANRSQAGTPVTVQQVIYAHAHTAGTRQYKPICKDGGAIHEGTTQTTTNTSTSAAPVVIDWPNNPATGNAWADSGIDSFQFGAKSVTTDVRVQATCLQILVDIAS